MCTDRGARTTPCDDELGKRRSKEVASVHNNKSRHSRLSEKKPKEAIGQVQSCWTISKPSDKFKAVGQVQIAVSRVIKTLRSHNRPPHVFVSQQWNCPQPNQTASSEDQSRAVKSVGIRRESAPKKQIRDVDVPKNKAPAPTNWRGKPSKEAYHRRVNLRIQICCFRWVQTSDGLECLAQDCCVRKDLLSCKAAMF